MAGSPKAEGRGRSVKQASANAAFTPGKRYYSPGKNLKAAHHINQPRAQLFSLHPGCDSLPFAKGRSWPRYRLTTGCHFLWAGRGGVHWDPSAGCLQKGNPFIPLQPPLNAPLAPTHHPIAWLPGSPRLLVGVAGSSPSCAGSRNPCGWPPFPPTGSPVEGARERGEGCSRVPL